MIWDKHHRIWSRTQTSCNVINSISPTEGGRGLGGLRSSPPSQGQVHRGAAEVDLDLQCFIKWTQFLIKSTKIGVFYQYGYIDITKNRDPWLLGIQIAWLSLNWILERSWVALYSVVCVSVRHRCHPTTLTAMLSLVSLEMESSALTLLAVVDPAM